MTIEMIGKLCMLYFLPNLAKRVEFISKFKMIYSLCPNFGLNYNKFAIIFEIFFREPTSVQTSGGKSIIVQHFIIEMRSYRESIYCSKMVTICFQFHGTCF